MFFQLHASIDVCLQKMIGDGFLVQDEVILLTPDDQSSAASAGLSGVSGSSKRKSAIEMENMSATKKRKIGKVAVSSAAEVLLTIGTTISNSSNEVSLSSDSAADGSQLCFWTFQHTTFLMQVKFKDLSKAIFIAERTGTLLFHMFSEQFVKSLLCDFVRHRQDDIACQLALVLMNAYTPRAMMRPPGIWI